MDVQSKKLLPQDARSAQRDPATNLKQAVADLVFDQLAEALAEGRIAALLDQYDIEVTRLEPLLLRVRATPESGLPRYFSVRVSEIM